MKKRQVIALAAVLAFVLSCDVVEKFTGLSEQEQQEIRLAVESMQQGSLEAAILAALTSQVVIVDSMQDMATDVSARVKTVFTPATCVEALVVDRSVNLSFNQCAGPYGIAGLDGAASLSFENSGGGVLASLTATTLGVNNTSLVISVTGVLSDVASQRNWEFTTTGVGTSQNLEAVTRNGSYRGKVDAECLELDGSWLMTVNDNVKLNTFSAFERCNSACPSGGTLVVASAEGTEVSERVITLTFTGAQTVSYISSDAKIGSVALNCQ